MIKTTVFHNEFEMVTELTGGQADWVNVSAENKEVLININEVLLQEPMVEVDNGYLYQDVSSEVKMSVEQFEEFCKQCNNLLRELV